MLLALSILIVLTTSFFCSISEAALLSVSRVRVESLAQKSRAAQIVSQLKDTLDRPVAAILILNTLANTGGAAVAGREYDRLFGGTNMALFTAALTVAVLIFSELVPKTLGVRYAEPASLFLARPLRALAKVMRPLTWLVERGSLFLGAGPRRPGASVEDIRAVARLAFSAKQLGREEQMIIEAASRLPRVSVSQIMIHREDIVAVSFADDEEEIMVKARRSMHTRIVLCRADLDDVIGIVNVKEVLWRIVQEPEDLEEDGLKRLLGEAARKPLFVSAEDDVTQLLQAFSKRHDHLALVKEGERIVGIVTLEDVIEELIGEVDDEYDRSPTDHANPEPGLWRFGGGTLWRDVAAELSLSAAEIDEDIDLDGRFDINDVSADMLRGKLRTGGVFTIGAYRFKVVRMRRGKVLRVDVRRIGPAPSTSLPPVPADAA